ncbi:MAG: helix-turn-helix domain-containing protein [Terriglobales bacterium]
MGQAKARPSETTFQPITFLDAEIVSQPQLADMLGIAVRTLRRMDARREAPPKIKVSRKTYYRRESVLRWLAERETRTIEPRRQRRAR